MRSNAARSSSTPLVVRHSAPEAPHGSVASSASSKANFQANASLCFALRFLLPAAGKAKVSPSNSESVTIWRLRPGGVVPLHRDPNRCFVQICLTGCTPGAYYQVGPDVFPYRAGEFLAFDGSYDHAMWVNHSTAEDSLDRVVLVLTLNSIVDYNDPSFPADQRSGPGVLPTNWKLALV